MKHLKTFEGWFRDLFKDTSNNMWDDVIASKMEDDMGYTKLMGAASEGNFKKFKYYYNDYINVDSIDIKDDHYLHVVVKGNGIVSDKIKMLKMLIDDGVDMFDEVEGKTFYEIIEQPKLKKWVEETYPDFIEELKLKRESDKYNL